MTSIEPTPTVDTAITSWTDVRPTRPRALCVLLHGFGSNEADLAGIGSALPVGFAWVSLRAPLATPGGGAAWFPITTPGSPETAPVEAATNAILDWLDANAPADAPIVPIGFSQGGLMATQLLRTAPHRVAATVLLGGFVLGAAQSGDSALSTHPPAVFSGRGSDDRVIAPAAVERTDAWLAANPNAVNRRYDGLGHGITAEELGDVIAFLDRVVP